MNSWTSIMNWILLTFLPWFETFSVSERVALAAALLVLVGVAGEYVIEVPAIDERERVRFWIKRTSMALLLLGLTGDILGIVMGQAEMAALTKTAGDAKTSADGARADFNDAQKQLHTLTCTVGTLNGQLGDEAAQLNTAKSQTAGVKEQADALASAFGDDLRQITEIHQSLAPRSISYWIKGDQSSFEELKPFADTKVELEVLTDVEARRAASEIEKILGFAKWNIVSVKPNPGLWTAANDGVNIEFHWTDDPTGHPPIQVDEHGEKAAQTLAEYLLLKQGWDAQARFGEPNSIPSDTIRVIVGFKPNPLFEPDWVKKMREEERRVIQRQQELEKRFPAPNPPN